MKRILIVLVAFMLVTAPAAGADASDFLEENGSVIDTIVSFAQGISERATNYFNPSTDTVTEAADDLRTEYNGNSAAYEAYINDRTSASTDLNVIRITLHDDDESVTVYLVGDVNGSNYENTSIVETLPDSRNGSDEYISLCGSAAKNSAEELETFRTLFVEEKEPISKAYQRKMLGEYAGQIKTSLLGHEGECNE